MSYGFGQTSPPTGTSTPDGRSQSFQPVEGGGEMQSGEKLLVEAYAAIWVILFVMLIASWRRQRRIDERVASLEGEVARVRARGIAADEAPARKASPESGRPLRETSGKA